MCVLMILRTFTAVSVSCAMLCMSMHTLDPSACLLQLSGLSGVCFAARLGGSGGFPHFWGMLKISGVFLAFNVFVSTLGASVHPIDMSAWFPRPSIPCGASSTQVHACIQVRVLMPAVP